MKTLFVRPKHDDLLGYLFYYSKDLIKESERRGFDTINKEKENACKKVVESIIKKQNPFFIMFNGHGSPELIAGHNNKSLIDGKNYKILKNRLIYSLSCSSADILGYKVGDKKTAFIGYETEFAVGMDSNCQASIHRDKLVKLFLEPSNLLVKALLKGNTAEEAVDKAKEEMKRKIIKLKAGILPNSDDCLPYIFNNYVALCVKGAVNKKIVC